jgi:hypothetical protein
VFSSDNYQGFGDSVPATASVERFSPALKNALLLALFFAYAIGFSLTFERALATLTQDDDPDPVMIVSP